MPEIPAALAPIWSRSLPVVRERLSLLQAAAEELTTTRTLAASLRQEATAVAHKFAGSLGMFGLHDATNTARAIEHLLEQDGLPQPEQFEQHVMELQSLLASHL